MHSSLLSNVNDILKECSVFASGDAHEIFASMLLLLLLDVHHEQYVLSHLQIHLRDHKEVGGVGDARQANCEQHLYLGFSMEASE